VSSGAIAEGRAIMKVIDKNAALSKKQALAAIGQGCLIQAYNDAFRRYGYTTAQILITREDLDNRRRYLNIRNTFTSLFELGAIPIINENDTVAVDEIQFTDNDMLSAMIIPLVEAQLMILLTDIEGVYDKDPRSNPDSRVISEIQELRTRDLKRYSKESNSMGRGGIQSKLQAAYRVSLLGVPTVIASAYTPQIVSSILEGKDIGTLIHSKIEAPLKQKDHWLSFVSRPKGSVMVDEGASSMVVNNGKSLLPCGVLSVQGTFRAGDPIEVLGEKGDSIAVGLSNFTAEEIDRIKGARSKDLYSILSHDCDEEVIHRNNMILREEM